MTMSDESFSTVFAQALRGHPCQVVGMDDLPRALPVSDWVRRADEDDERMLDLCLGATLDVGCGPGRLSAALAERGQVVLGIDVVHEAVGQTRERGVSALRRDVFGALPGEGRWMTALLADGNVGIGGDPVALLDRIHQLLHPRGQVVVELAAPGIPDRTVWATLECDGTRSRPFRWSVSGVDGIDAVAARAGFVVDRVVRTGERWCAVLRAPRTGGAS